MTNPELATVLRNMKVPERMTGSQALRAFLLEHAEDAPKSPEELQQLNGLILISHLELVNALGVLEERFALARTRKRRRWF